MKKYTETIATISVIIGGFIGFINWIILLANSLSEGETLWFVLQLLFAEIIVPLYSIIPFLISFVVLFLGILPIYGIYKLIKQ